MLLILSNWGHSEFWPYPGDVVHFDVIFPLIQKLRGRSKKVVLIKVKSHASCFLNKRADERDEKGRQSDKTLPFLHSMSQCDQGGSQKVFHIFSVPVLNFITLGQQLTIKSARFWQLLFKSIWQLTGLFTMKLCSVRQSWFENWSPLIVLQSGRQVSDSVTAALQVSLGGWQPDFMAISYTSKHLILNCCRMQTVWYMCWKPVWLYEMRASDNALALMCRLLFSPSLQNRTFDTDDTESYLATHAADQRPDRKHKSNFMRKV